MSVLVIRFRLTGRVGQGFSNGNLAKQTSTKAIPDKANCSLSKSKHLWYLVREQNISWCGSTFGEAVGIHGDPSTEPGLFCNTVGRWCNEGPSHYPQAEPPVRIGDWRNP